MFKVMTILALLATLGLVGCNTEEKAPDLINENPVIISGETDAQKTSDEEVIKPTYNSLKSDLDLFNLIKEDGNFMVSPFSMKMAMMLAANGADGETKTEILNALNISGIDEYNDYAKDLIEKYNNNQNVNLNVANSIWLNTSVAGKSIDFSDDYKKIIENYYDGIAKSLDEDSIAHEINSWVENKTNSKIKNLLDEKEKAKFLSALVNTIYFKGSWANQFDEYATHEDVFLNKNGESVKTNFMHQTAKFDYYEDDYMKMIKLPYKGYETSMYVVLPEDKEKMDIDHAMQNMDFYKVKLAMPKFKTEYFISLNNLLKEIGINKAFDVNGAEFKNKMFNGVAPDGNVYISEVLQKTFIDVDENGTEAAAATAVIMNLTSAMPQAEEIKEFKADKPFLYFIMDDETNDILFMGQVNEF